MPESSADGDVIIRLHDSIDHIDASQWARLVEDESPFLHHGVLRLFETSGCVGEGTGWMPLFFAAYTKDGDDDHLVGALPFYIKTNSAGEFVFDWGWADAAHRAGIEYYPKGLVAVPFTPVTGRRVLVRKDHPEVARLGRLLVEAACEVADKQLGLSSVHFNFILPEEQGIFEDLNIPMRYGVQYHWYNRSGVAPDASAYEDFDDFLARFRSKRRANLRRERRKLAAQGVTTRVVWQEGFDEQMMHKMFVFYKRTIDKFHWGRQYLNEDFFQGLPDIIPEHLHFVVGSLDGEDVAGAFNLCKDRRLYGRYWGATQDLEFAHFEVCMYTPITWCIEHGVEVFEPGAGGEHKFERGFEPTLMHSAHHIHHPGLKGAIGDFLKQERRHIREQVEGLNAESILKP